MAVLFSIGAALCLVSIFGIRPLRRCAAQALRRSTAKQSVYNSDPDTHSAQRSWGKRMRFVAGKRAPGPLYEYPEQIETRRQLRTHMPSRTPDGQSQLWTALFYLLSFAAAACLVIVFALLVR